MRALITGIGGFVGRHLAPLLKQEGFEVWGVDRVPVSPGHPAAVAAQSIALGDVCDPVISERLVRAVRPTHVFHLAGAYGRDAAGRAASNDPDVVGFTSLLESLQPVSPGAWVMLASSSAVYGAPEQLPIDEDAPLKPTTSYGASKIAAEIAAEHFRLHYKMSVVSVRSFNLIGPHMPSRLFAGAIAAQVVNAERGGTGVVKTGRLDARRDYVDVRDAAVAYLKLAQMGHSTASVYNVCSGVSHSCRELADEMVSEARVGIELAHDESRVQRGDVDEQIGSAERIRRDTGWTPETPFSTSVKDVLLAARAAADNETETDHNKRAT